MDFELLGYTVHVSDGKRNYMKIRSDFIKMAVSASAAFSADYQDTFSLTIFSSSYAEKFTKKYASNYMDKLVMQYVAATRKYLAQYGLYTITDQEIWNACISDTSAIPSQMQLCFENWLVELACSDDHAVTDGEVVPQIKRKMESGYFNELLKNEIMKLLDYTLTKLHDEGKVEIEFIKKQPAKEAAAIYNNLQSGCVPPEETKRLAVTLVENDCRNILYYEYIFKKFPEWKFEIARLASYLYIDLSPLIQEDLNTSYQPELALTEAAALQMIENLQAAMDKYGVTTCESFRALQGKLDAFDVEARTYQGVLYGTREERTQAEIDDQILRTLCGDIGVLEKDACQKLITQIKAHPYIEQIQNKYIQHISQRIDVLDYNFLTQLTSGLDTMSEAKCEEIKAQMEDYDAAEEVKAPFYRKLETRLKEIWEVEDFAIYREIFINTPVGNQEAMMQSVDDIRRIGRTELKEQVVNALYRLQDTEVMAAAKYLIAQESGSLTALMNIGKKSTFQILTLNGKLIHPAIAAAAASLREKKKGSFLTSLREKKPVAQEDKARGTFCPNCGKRVVVPAKFCANCGNRLE